MKPLRRLFLRIAALFTKQRAERDFDTEIQTHLAMHIEDNLRTGMSASEARRQALLKFGGVEQAKENYRDRRSLPLLETLLRDLRFAIRVLRKNPGFAAVAILTLALGIGANTAIFSVVNSVLIRPLPYRDPESLVMVWETNSQHPNPHNTVSPPNFLDWQNRNTVFSSMAFVFDERDNLTGNGDPEEIVVQDVSTNFFSLLGVNLLLGAGFTPENGQPGHSDVVILGYGLWKERFAADPAIVGKSVLLNGHPQTIVGIAPQNFDWFIKDGSLTGGKPQMWSPFVFPQRFHQHKDVGRFMTVVARLKTDVTHPQAQTEMSAIAARLEQEDPDFDGHWGVNVVPLRQQISGELRPALIVLFGAVAFVLLIACANVSSLLLARAANREREMAIRTAIGASRSRIAGQLLMESLLLALIGGGIGVTFAVWGTNALLATSPRNLLDLRSISIDLPVLAFAAATTLFAGLLFGFLPSYISAHSHLSETLKKGGRGSARRAFAGNAFVVAQLGLALVLLTGSGLLIRSFIHLIGVDPGFHAGQLLTFKVALPGSKYGTDQSRMAFFQQLLARISVIPGVRSTSVESFPPLTGLGAATNVRLLSQPSLAPADLPVANVQVVGPGYFSTMSIPLRAGRLFNALELSQEKHVAIINQTFADKYLHTVDPLGQKAIIDMKDEAENQPSEIIGVVGDVHQMGLDTAPEPTVYWPLPELVYSGMTILVRTSNDPLAVLSAARAELQQIDPQLPMAAVATMDQLLADSLARSRFTMLLLGVFAIVALVLAAVGIYGLIAYSITQRTQARHTHRPGRAAQRYTPPRACTGHAPHASRHRYRRARGAHSLASPGHSAFRCERHRPSHFCRRRRVTRFCRSDGLFHPHAARDACRSHRHPALRIGILMPTLRAWSVRFTNLFGNDRRKRSLAAELQSHLHLHVENNLRGHDAEQARQEALMKLSGIERAKELHRGRHGWQLPEILRRLAKSTSLATLCLLFVASWPLQAADKRTQTIDELISLKRPSEPVISPDGRFVAYAVRYPNWTENQYDKQIWLADTQTGELTQLTNSKRSNSDLAWSPDGRWLGFISNRDGKLQIYVISPLGGEARKITDVEVGVWQYRWSPDSTHIAFTTTDPETEEVKQRREKYSDFEVVRREYRMDHLWVVGLGDGNLRRLTRGNQYSVGSFSWSPDGRRLAFDAQVTPDLSSEASNNIYVYNFDSGSVKKLIDEQGPDRNPLWSPDGKRIAFETAMGKPDFYTQNIIIGIVPVEEGAVSPLTADFDERVSLVAWAPEGIYFSAAQKTATHLFRVDPNSRNVERITPQEGAAYSFFSFSPDYKQLTFIEADSTHYPEVYVSSKAFAPGKLEPRKLTNFAVQLKDFTIAKREIISWKNSAGAVIEGALMKPQDFDPTKKYPLLVVIHGGPGDTTSQAVLGFDDPYYPKETWVAKGALVLEPNYRGSAGYGLEFHRLLVRTVGAGTYDDVISGVNDLIARGWVDKNRVGAMGWSFGGFISAWITTNSDRFKAVSVGAGPTDWALNSTCDLPELTRQYLGAIPAKDPEIYRRSSPMTYIKQAQTPTMIEHGEFDSFVPIGSAYELYQGLLEQGVPARFYMYKGFGHSITRPKSNRAVMQHNLNWFNHYLWGEPDADDAK